MLVIIFCIVRVIRSHTRGKIHSLYFQDGDADKNTILLTSNHHKSVDSICDVYNILKS